MTTMASSALTPADKAVLAMSSSDYLNMVNPKATEPYSPSECSPVSSVFSPVWSRRPSASSTDSQRTDDDEVDECPNQSEYRPITQTQTPQNLCLEPPEALTIGACIIHVDQETLEPAVLMVQHDAGHHTNQHVVHDAVWHLPCDRVSEDDFSLSDAMARIVRDQTSLSIQKVVGVLPQSRHHLHQPQDSRSRTSTSATQQAISVDLTCAATAASLAAAHAARMSRNVSVSATDCSICDFMPASKRRDALLNWRKMARRNRANSSASRWSRYSDSSSSSASEGAASDSGESTCRLLRDEATATTTTNNTITAAVAAARAALAQEQEREQEQETDGVLYMKIPPKSARNSRKTSPTRLRVKYKPLAQDPPTTNIEDDGNHTATEEDESDDFLSDNDGVHLHPSASMSNSHQPQITTTTTTQEKKHLEAIQLTYMVLSTNTTSTTAESILATKKYPLSLITSTNLETHRMTPQTRTLVRQALSWASGYFYPISPLDDNDDGDDDQETTTANDITSRNREQDYGLHVQREEESSNFADGEESDGDSTSDPDSEEDDSTDQGAPLSPRQSR